MISLKNKGNSIASEFMRLTGNSQIEKTAQMGGPPTEDTPEEPGADQSALPAASEADDSPEDFLVDQVEIAEDPASAALDNEIESIESFSSSDSGSVIMGGLGKIAAGLRQKGEGFAADMVEATAMSIGDDLKKEAQKKSGVISGLKKLASEFDSEGDSFAADMVRATINNIVSG